MSHNRISGMLPQAAFVSSACNGGFVVCPAVLQQGVADDQQVPQWQIYRLALEQASAVVRPSIMERWQRDLLN